MKKMLTLGGAVAALVILAGCAGVTTNNGSIGPVCAGPNFFSNVSGNAKIEPITGKYTVVKRGVKAEATLQSYFACVHIGDVSYATLKAKALENVKDATDLTDVVMDYSFNNICGVAVTTVKLTATAIKY